MTWKYHIPEKGKIIETDIDHPRMDGSERVFAMATGEMKAGKPTMIHKDQEMAVCWRWRYKGEGDDMWRESYWEEP